MTPTPAEPALSATEQMLDLAALAPGAVVLDVGAGAPARAVARRVHPTGSVLAHDGESLDLPGDTFDAVLCRAGLWHLTDAVRALAGIRRVLKPGGRVVALGAVAGALREAGFRHVESVVVPAPQALGGELVLAVGTK